MRVVVTGATGFIGHAVSHRLRSNGHAVAGLVTSERGALPDGVDRIVVEAPWSVDALEGVLREHATQGLVHAVGGPRSDTAALYADNVVTQERVLDALFRATPGARAVIVGSAAEYGRPPAGGVCHESDVARPVSPYGIAKLAQTHHALLRFGRGQDVRVGRVFNPVGARMGSGLAFSDFARRLANGCEALRTGDLSGKRDFLPVDEAARILAELLAHPNPDGLVVNVCSGVASPVRDGVERLLEIESSRRGVKVLLQSGAPDPHAEPVVFGSTERLRSLGIAPATSAIDNELRALHHKALANAASA